MRLFPATFVVTCVVALLSLTACPPKPSGAADAGFVEQTDAGMDAGSTETQMTDLCPRLSRLLCQQAASCSCVNVGAEAECLKTQNNLCERAFALPLAGVVTGRLTFDSQAAEVCIAGIARSIESCGSPANRPDITECSLVFRDAAKIGSECSALNRGLGCDQGVGICSDTDRCVALPSLGQPCDKQRCGKALTCVDSTCVKLNDLPAPQPVGANCSSSIPCEVGLTCNELGICAETRALGATCEDSTAEPCGRNRFCYRGTTRLCQVKAQENERCMGDDCANGLFCDYTARLPVCKKAAKLNESCAGNVACETPWVCDQSETCVALPGLGENCVAGQCAAGTQCNAANTCVALAAENASCDRLDGCAPGLVCDLSGMGSGNCVKLAAEGEACLAMDERCNTGLFCDAKTNLCRSPLSLGEACSSPRACGPEGECVYDAPGQAQCRPLGKTVGDACGFTCGQGLRCVQLPGVCAHAVCSVL